MAVPESRPQSQTNSTNGANGYAPNVNAQELKMSTAGLKSLQSGREKELFDTVDRLRSLDVNHELDLPQLVVCGSQSSGKSSVLEAISQLPFPRGEMTCTRIVTEIQYRRGDERRLQVDIVPDKSRPVADQRQLEGAKFVNQDLMQLPVLVKEAEKRLGLSGTQGFAKDVLRIQITGPDQQPLTLVDLPGLIGAHSKGREYISFVKTLVDDWIMEKNSIILAVVDANNDPQRQEILTRAKEIDPTGERTFGIITKPDLTDRSSDSERFWINLARNNTDRRSDFSFKKGWHVLRNRKFEEKDAPVSTRDAKEREFFEDPNENWHVVDPRYWGIDSLRDRLRNLLYDHTRNQLPQVRRDITEKLLNYNKDLRSIESRLHKPEQLWSDYIRECKGLEACAIVGVDGKYNHPFYNISPWGERTPRHVRSRIEEAHDAFFEEITAHGHGIRLEGAEDGLDEDMDGFALEIKKMLDAMRGEELPGRYDPQRLHPLFWKHSERWYSIAEAHIQRAHDHCSEFIEKMINEYLRKKLPALPGSVSARILEHLEAELDQQRELARMELDQLEADRTRAAKTRNPAFKQRSERKMAEKHFSSTMRTLKGNEQESSADGSNRVLRVTPSSLRNASSPEGHNSDAENLGTDMLIYYEIARDVFVDNVIVQVIERHLAAPLHTLFNSDFGIDQTSFFDMLDQEDTRSLKTEKEGLEQKIANLRRCQAELS